MKPKIIIYNTMMHSLLFGLGFNLIASISKTNLILSIILGTFIDILLLRIFSNKPNKYLSIIISLIIIIIYMIIFSTYITSFYLINMPSYIINILIILLTIYIVSKSPNVLNKVCFLITIFNLIVYLIMFITLFTKINYPNYLPINLNLSLIKGSLVYSGISIIPYLYLDNKQSFKDNFKSLIISSFITIMISILVLGILGPNFIIIYRYPEYMILKEIKLFNCINNLENIIAFIFGNEILISMILSLNNIKNLITKKTNYYLIISLLIIISLIINASFINYLNQYIINFLIISSILLIISKKFFKYFNTFINSFKHKSI